MTLKSSWPLQPFTDATARSVLQKPRELELIPHKPIVIRIAIWHLSTIEVKNHSNRSQITQANLNWHTRVTAGVGLLQSS